MANPMMDENWGQDWTRNVSCPVKVDSQTWSVAGSLVFFDVMQMGKQFMNISIYIYIYISYYTALG